MTQLNVMFSKTRREENKQCEEEAEERCEAGGGEQVAEPSRCCGEAAKQIMSCLDYLRDTITVERPHLGQLQAGSAGISCSHCRPACLSCLSPALDQPWMHQHAEIHGLKRHDTCRIVTAITAKVLFKSA